MWEGRFGRHRDLVSPSPGGDGTSPSRTQRPCCNRADGDRLQAGLARDFRDLQCGSDSVCPPPPTRRPSFIPRHRQSEGAALRVYCTIFHQDPARIQTPRGGAPRGGPDSALVPSGGAVAPLTSRRRRGHKGWGPQGEASLGKAPRGGAIWRRSFRSGALGEAVPRGRRQLSMTS